MFKIGIIGSGSMGSGIAQVAATAGHETLIYDSNPAALEKAKTSLLNTLNKLAAKGKIDDRSAKAIFGRVYFVDNLSAFAECGLVVEAIVEDLNIKKSVFSELESIVNNSCILATNTSSLSVTAIAAACQNPGRVIGVHFFNPVPLMKLVEIIPAIQTQVEITNQSRKLIP